MLNRFLDGNNLWMTLVKRYRQKDGFGLSIKNYQLFKYIQMKKSILIICAFVVSSFGLFAQAPVQAPAAQTTPKDSIVFESLTHDYGTIVQGGDGTCEFKFANKGKAPIVLNDVKASCGCTVPEWTKTPVNPGEKGTIKVTYNTNNVGAFTKSITVNSNAKNSPLVLTIKGIVTAKQ